MTELGIIGYAAVAVLYTFLTVLLLVNWRGQAVGASLIAAGVASAVWAAALGADLYGPPVSPSKIFVVEVLRTGTWLAFPAILLARIGAGRLVTYAGPVIGIAVLFVGVLFLLRPDAAPQGLTLTTVLNTGGLLMAMAGLLMVEQLHRNTPHESRPGLKVLMLGIGGIFAYDLFLYSQGLMLGGIEQWAWTFRGGANALIVPVIALAARSNKEWDIEIFVSRQVVFYSTTLTAVGVYLLLMSAVGYWIVMQGRTWSSLASATFFVGAGVLLVVMLFSSSLRARLRVFLSKHFFRNKYDYRMEWLRLIATLARIEDSSAREIAVKALAQIVKSPSGLLWMLSDDGATYDVSSSYNCPSDAPPIRATDSLVEFMREDRWIIDLEEYSVNPSIYKNMQIPEWLAKRDGAWLMAPLIARNELLGIVLLDKAAGPLALNYEDRDLLKTVGNHVAVHLVQERTDELLSEARQFEAYNRLTAFLMHDLNNLIAQQSLIVSNAARHKRNPDFVDDAMNTIANSVERMKRVMAQLKRGEADRAVRPTELKFIVSAAVDRCMGQPPEPKLEFMDDSAMIEVDADRLTMVLVHLIRNAQDSTPADGVVVVSTARSDGNVIVRVRDNGCGMSPEFLRNRLFRPFDSTKGSQGMGIGAYQAREFARRMGGDLKADSEVGKGTTMTLRLPLL